MWNEEKTFPNVVCEFKKKNNSNDFGLTNNTSLKSRGPSLRQKEPRTRVKGEERAREEMDYWTQTSAKGNRVTGRRHRFERPSNTGKCQFVSGHLSCPNPLPLDSKEGAVCISAA